MRLWHKDLISVLPRKQLLSQWRECCAIAKNISANGTPNHILVNKIMKYPISEFVHYAQLVYREMIARGYKADYNKFIKNFPLHFFKGYWELPNLYDNWHNDRYLIQCYFNLQEKYDCGGISFEEWEKIDNYMTEAMKL